MGSRAQETLILLHVVDADHVLQGLAVEGRRRPRRVVWGFLVLFDS